MKTGEEILREMIGQAAVNEPPTQSNAHAALSIALGKIGREVFDCQATLKDGSVCDIALKDMLAAAPSPGLLIVVTVRDLASRVHKGILMLDGMLINGLVELMASASDRAVYRKARIPTLIDISLCREFCDGVLAAFPAELTKLNGQAELGTITWLEPEIEASRLAFALENQTYVKISGEVSLQDGLRGGAISLVLPQRAWQAPVAATEGPRDPEWQRDLTKNVMAARLPLRANLENIELPLAHAIGLRAGDLVELSSFALSDLALVTNTGQVLLHGHLGQENGKKAVSITRLSHDNTRGSNTEHGAQAPGSDPAPDFVAEPASLPEQNHSSPLINKISPEDSKARMP